MKINKDSNNNNYKHFNRDKRMTNYKIAVISACTVKERVLGKNNNDLSDTMMPWTYTKHIRNFMGDNINKTLSESMPQCERLTLRQPLKSNTLESLIAPASSSLSVTISPSSEPSGSLSPSTSLSSASPPSCSVLCSSEGIL